jgi:quercetin dioxygenase-like cupin family protein
VERKIVLGPTDGKLVHLQGLGVRYLTRGAETGGRVALVEHPIQPRALASPIHTHHDEDEISYVVGGTIGAQIGDQIVVAGPGSLVFKPRGIPHAFWNAGDTIATVLEVITPGGFEGYFEELAEVLTRPGGPDPARIEAIRQKYHLDLDLSSIPRLIQEHGLSEVMSNEK